MTSEIPLCSNPCARPLKNGRQRGVALYVVIVVVLLSTLLALWASRTALFGELIVGNDADYQRAFEAAQGMMQDAELDIRGEQPNGSACTASATNTDICRVGTTVWFIDEDKDLVGVLSKLEAASTGCIKGMCTKRTGIQDWWNDSATLTAMIATNVGARYGQFTGAKTGSASNPILNITTAGRGAWYWVEIMPYDVSPSGLVTGTKKLDLNLNPAVVYRITAIARGLKPSTQVVLQSTFARQKIKD